MLNGRCLIAIRFLETYCCLMTICLMISLFDSFDSQWLLFDDLNLRFFLNVATSDELNGLNLRLSSLNIMISDNVQWPLLDSHYSRVFFLNK